MANTKGQTPPGPGPVLALRMSTRSQASGKPRARHTRALRAPSLTSTRPSSLHPRLRDTSTSESAWRSTSESDAELQVQPLASARVRSHCRGVGNTSTSEAELRPLLHRPRPPSPKHPNDPRQGHRTGPRAVISAIANHLRWPQTGPRAIFSGIAQQLEWPRRWRLRQRHLTAISILGAFALGHVLHPNTTRLLTKMHRLAAPEEPTILCWNGTLISAVDRFLRETKPLDTPLIAPPAKPATIPHGIRLHARSVFALCKYADLLPDRPDVDSHCREFRDAYDAVIPNTFKLGWQAYRELLQDPIHRVKRHTLYIHSLLDWTWQMYGDDLGLDDFPLSVDTRLTHGSLSNSVAKELQQALNLLQDKLSCNIGDLDKRILPVSTMTNAMGWITETFAYEASKLAFAKRVGDSSTKHIQQLLANTQSRGSLAFLTVVLDALEGNQLSMQRLRSDLDNLYTYVQQARDSYKFDENVVRWVGFPWLLRLIFHLFPAGPFLEDALSACRKLEEAVATWKALSF